MKQVLIQWLLRLLGSPVPVLPHLTVYAVVISGERLASVTTNRLRGRALALESQAKGQPCRLVKCVPIDVELFP